MAAFSARGRDGQRGRHEPAVERPDTDVAHGKDLLAAGRWAEGEQHLRDLLARREAQLPPGDPRIHGARMAYGSALLAVHRPEEALSAFAVAAAEAQRDLGRHHPAALAARLQVVDALIHCGRLVEGETQARALVHIYEGARFAGPRFAPQRNRARIQLGKVLGQAGRIREAIDVSDRMLPEAARDLGIDHPYVLTCRVNRTQQLAALGLFPEAEAECAALVATAAGLAGQRHPAASLVSMAAANNLAFSYAESGRPAEAELVVRAPLAEAEQLLGPASDFAQALRLNLVTALVGQGRHEEALAAAEPLPALSPAQPGSRALARAEALYGLSRYVEAEATAFQALTEASAYLAPIHHRVLRTRTLLALLHDSPEEMRSVTADWTRHFGPDHPRTRAARAAC